MNPEVWGPYGWKVLHRMAYAVADVREGRTFFRSLVHLLPCHTCREAYQKHLDHVPFPVTKTGIGRWVYDIHHRVNRSKMSGTWEEAHEPSYTAVEALYKSRRHILDPDEWRFVQAIVEGRRADAWREDDFPVALEAFLRSWCKASGILWMVEEGRLRVQSAQKMSAWLRSHVKKGRRDDLCQRSCHIGDRVPNA